MNTRLENAYPLDLNETVSNRIVRLLNCGESRDFVFRDIYQHCEFSLETPASRQDLADQIAKLDLMNVFAEGTIPKSHTSLSNVY